MIGNSTRLGSDERGVSEVLGAILVFGLLISLIAILQMNAVPNANKEVEYQHSIEVQSDMADLREAITKTASEGTSKSSGVNLGVSYPPRFLFLNPSDAEGQLRTTDPSTVTLSNIRGSGDGQTLYTDPSTDYEYSTRSITYRAGYKRLEGAPTIYREVGIAHEQYPSSEIVESEPFVSGQQITLVTINGSLQQTSVAARSVETTPISAPARTVAVTNTTGENMEITVPTQLSEESWEEALAPQRVSNGGHVVSLTYSERSNQDNLLTVELEQGVTYDLRMARVGVGQNLDSQTEAYQTTVEGDNESVIDNGLKRVTVEVRDRYNNPVSGEKVNLTIVQNPGDDNGTFVVGTSTPTTVTVTTGADGRASAIYDPPDIQEDFRDVRIRSSTLGVPPQPWTASFDVSNRNNSRITVRAVDSGGPIGEPPKTPPNQFDVTDKSTQTQTGCIPELGICLGPTDNASIYEVDWKVEDSRNDDPNSELDTVEIRLINSSTGRIIDSEKYDVEGELADGNTVVGEQGGYGKDHLYVKILYADKGGYVREARLPRSNTDNADGTGSWQCDQRNPC